MKKNEAIAPFFFVFDSKNDNLLNHAEGVYGIRPKVWMPMGLEPSDYATLRSAAR